MNKVPLRVKSQLFLVLTLFVISYNIHIHCIASTSSLSAIEYKKQPAVNYY